ncbi:IclR family transcriptional regulator, partial [Burkholderia pseudomallei]
TPEQRARMIVEHTKVEGEIALDMREFDALLHENRASGRLRQKSRQAFGVTDIADPVLGPSGHPIAALTCPSVRPSDTH